MVDHVLGLRAGTIPDSQRLDTSEKVMKNLLLANLTSWMGAADIQGLILSSWKSVLTHVDPSSASGCLVQNAPFFQLAPPSGAAPPIPAEIVADSETENEDGPSEEDAAPPEVDQNGQVLDAQALRRIGLGLRPRPLQK